MLTVNSAGIGLAALTATDFDCSGKGQLYTRTAWHDRQIAKPLISPCPEDKTKAPKDGNSAPGRLLAPAGGEAVKW